jgi:hypothetical protein
MPDYRITVRLRMGETKSETRYYSKHDKEDVRQHFEKKVYEIYPKYLVENIDIERVD